VGRIIKLGPELQPEPVGVEFPDGSMHEFILNFYPMEEADRRNAETERLQKEGKLKGTDLEIAIAKIWMTFSDETEAAMRKMQTDLFNAMFFKLRMTRTDIAENLKKK
jgi:hypothetical protein